MSRLKQILKGVGISALIFGVTYLGRGLEELKDSTRFIRDNQGHVSIQKKDTIGYKPIYSRLVTLSISETGDKSMMIWEHKKSYLHIMKNKDDKISIIFIDQQDYCEKCDSKITPAIRTTAEKFWTQYWQEMNGQGLENKLKKKLSP